MSRHPLMSKRPTNDVLKARAEAAELLGLDPGRLGPADVLRCDLVATLRATIDRTSAELLAGGGTVSILGVHTSAIEQLRKLLPEYKLAPPPEHREDPRQVMWEIYKQMRERGEIGLKALPPEGDSQHRIDELKAENERLRGLLAGVVGHDQQVAGKTLAIDPAEVVPPAEYLGVPPMRGPDDPPPRSTTVIEATAAAAPAAAPQPQMVDLRAGTGNSDEPWRQFVEPDGTIRTTPRGRGHYFGPV
jgi:hypothetical protein